MWQRWYVAWIILWLAVLAIAITALVFALSANQKTSEFQLYYNSGANLINDSFLRDGNATMCEQCTERLITNSGTVSNLSVKLYAPSAGGSSTVFTLRKNGIDTPMTVTILAGAQTGCNDQSPVTVEPFDVLSLVVRFVGNPTTGAIVTAEIKS
jgi:hypothetical protein